MSVAALARLAPAATLAAVRPPIEDTTVAPWVPVTSPTKLPVKPAAVPDTLPVTFPDKVPVTLPITFPVTLPVSGPAKAGAVTVPVKVGEARGAFASRAVCVAVDTGLLLSRVLFKLPRPRLLRAVDASARSLRLLAAFRLPVAVPVSSCHTAAPVVASVQMNSLPAVVTQREPEA